MKKLDCLLSSYGFYIIEDYQDGSPDLSYQAYKNSEGYWIIVRNTNTGSQQTTQTIRYAYGTLDKDYATAWTNRATLNYSDIVKFA